MSQSPNHQTPASTSRALQPLSDPGLPVPFTGQSPAYMTSSHVHASAPEGLSSAPSASALLHSLRRCWPIALLVALVGTAAAIVAVVLILPGQYVAAALIQVSPPPVMNEFGERYVELRTFRDNQKAIILSTTVLNEALKHESVKDFPEIKEQINPAEWLRSQLKVDFKEGPAILRLSMAGQEPQMLQLLVNAVANTYAEHARQEEIQLRKSMEARLKLEFSKIKDRIQNKTGMLQEYRVSNGIPSPEQTRSRLESYHRNIEAMHKQLTDLRLKEKTLESDLKVYNATREKLQTRPVDEGDLDIFLANDQTVITLRAEIAKRQGEIQNLMSRVRDKNLGLKLSAGPQRQKEAVEKQLKRYRDSKKNYVRREQSRQLEIKIEETSGRLESSTEQKKLVQQEIDTFNEDLNKLRNRAMRKEEVALESDIKLAEDNLQQLRKQLSSLQGRGAAQPSIIVRQEADLPREIDRSRQFKYAGATGLGVFGLLLMGVALLEFRSRKINTAEDVSKGLGMGVVGTLPLLPVAARKPKIASPTKRDLYWQSALTESIDSVRTLLLHSARSEGLQVVMVTSAVDGEGKTSIASQLAASLARGWKKTLLVDGDLRNPAVHRLFDQPADPGLCEVLRGDVQMADAVHPTNMSRLWIMPAGQWDNHAVQALAQEGVDTLFEQMKEQYDFIVVDSCPILPVADSLALAEHVDAVLFSVLRDVSRGPSIYAAQQRLSNLGVRTLGAVVIGSAAVGGAYRYPASHNGK